MKAVAYQQSLPIDAANSLVDVELPAPVASLNILPLKLKSVSVHWELMFTRSLFTTADLARQGELLAELAKLVDAGRVRTTLTENLGRIDAANLRRAHALIEGGKTRGKVVLAGF